MPGPVPYSIEAVGAPTYTEKAQSVITKQFRVKVLSKDARPVAKVLVFFSIIEGSATLSDSTVLTDAEGIATVDVSTGFEVQTIKIRAFVPALENPSIQFSLEVVSQMPAAIHIVSGDLQEVPAHTALSDVLLVNVVDAFGNVVKNITVDFSLTAGDGTIDSDHSPFKTNDIGNAYAKFTTGTVTENIVTASVGESIHVDFTIYTLIPVTLNPIISSQEAANLSWTKNVNSTFDHYSILRSPARSNSYAEVGSISDPDVTVFADKQAEIGRAYTYIIRVVTKGNSIDSNEKTGEHGELIDLKNESDFADVIMNNDKSAIYVAQLWSKRILIISPDSFQKIDSIELNAPPHALAVSPDGTKLYVALYGLPKFQVIDLATKSLLHEIDIAAVLGTDAAIGDIYMTADGQLFASAYNGYVARIDESDNYSAIRAASGEFFFSASPTFITDRGKYLYVEESRLSPNSLFKIDLSMPDAPIVLESGHGTVNGTRGCVLSTDGTLLYLTSGEVVSANTLKPVGQLNGPELYSLQVSDQKLFGCFFGGAFERWQLDRVDIPTQVVEKSIPLGFKSERMYLSADEKNAFLVSLPISPYYTVRIYKINVSN